MVRQSTASSKWPYQRLVVYCVNLVVDWSLNQTLAAECKRRPTLAAECMRSWQQSASKTGSRTLQKVKTFDIGFLFGSGIQAADWLTEWYIH